MGIKNVGERGLHSDTHGATAKACPECGFDIIPKESCGVCGYDPQRDLCQQKLPERTSIVPLISSICIIAVFTCLSLINTARQPEPVDPQGADARLPDPATVQAASADSNPSAETLSVQTKSPTPPPVATFSQSPNNDQSPPIESGPTAVTDGSTSKFDITERTSHPPLSSRSEFVSWMLSHTNQGEKYLKARWDRAKIIREAESIKNLRVLEAFLLTPREYFCRDPRRAYESAALPIGYGQTISGPHMVARMTDYLNPEPFHKVLEIGTGSGYQSAVLSELSNHVYTIEIVSALGKETDSIYLKHMDRFPEYGNIIRKIDDGYFGWPEYAPFDRIIVTCGIDHIPPELLKQLAPDGIMVIPVGPPSGQTIIRIVKRVSDDGSVTLEREDIFHGRRKEVFVPFTAREGGRHTTPSPSGAEK